MLLFLRPLGVPRFGRPPAFSQCSAVLCDLCVLCVETTRKFRRQAFPAPILQPVPTPRDSPAASLPFAVHFALCTLHSALRPCSGPCGSTVLTAPSVSRGGSRRALCILHFLPPNSPSAFSLAGLRLLPWPAAVKAVSRFGRSPNFRRSLRALRLCGEGCASPMPKTREKSY